MSQIRLVNKQSARGVGPDFLRGSMTVQSKYWLYCLLTIACLAPASDKISLEKIMQDPIWMGRIPKDFKLSLEGDALYFKVNRKVPLAGQWLRLDLEDRAVTEVTSQQRPDLLRTASHRKGTVRIDEIAGDLWLAKGHEPATPLISRTEPLTFVRFLNEHSIIYREGNNLFQYDLRTGGIVQVTALTLKEEKETKDDFYRQQEKRLFEHVAQNHEREEFEKQTEAENRMLGTLTKPKTAYLGKDYSFAESWFEHDAQYGIDVSSDLNYVTVVLEPESSDQTEYAQFINNKGRFQTKKARPRVAPPKKTWKMAVVRPQSGEVSWLNLDDLPEIKTDRLAEIQKDLTEAEKALLPKKPKEDSARPVQLIPGGFQGDQFLLTAISLDYKDRWIFLLNVVTMEKTLVYHEYDLAWVQYANRRLNVDHHLPGSAAWQEGQIYFVSEATGYQHLYNYHVATKKLEQLTRGNFEVHHPFRHGEYWYFHANKKHPGEYHYYRMPQGGGSWQQLSEGEGFHQVKMSEDGKLMVDLYSKTNLPPVFRVRKGEAAWEEVYDGRSEDFKAIDWVAPQVLTYRNRSGKNVYARLYQPAKPNGAGVVFVHGAGYLQNAHKGWSSYYREYMYHNLLMQQGYTVLDPDFQASAGYGHDWRTAIYRHMGGADLNDILDGASWLVKSKGLDSQRLGVYGGSYGGFITYMAMFKSPDTFKAGAALRPVSDWAHYNHWYTARILNTPSQDPRAYRQSSPINFAEGLKGRLLIAHGMEDDNVQYIDSVRLTQRLIELHKHDWELASYPVEHHGFRAPSSWYDEYRRIFELFQESIGP